ncbi:hypothetical protein KK092_09630 [Curtobacterium flaccumfaciens pv. flaccumfaciens]|uniref:hypothetical protein n=1 Tax=Curtobacterium flaccumfaciens TaxID=2035 RepID=UPI001BDE0A6E|nr:hypothetical protein [Curtobacterium flaccumfaciens]MBT1669641.1 hypothetical protein [Curtobacterium flaccumfaciens pv. flaccumfaciens]
MISVAAAATVKQPIAGQGARGHREQQSTCETAQVPATSTSDPEALRLDWHLRLIDATVEHLRERGHWNLATPGSELARDDGALMPFQASHLVGHCLVVALDALHSAKLLLRADDGSLRVPLVGAYPLLRTAIESASMAVWVLQPTEREERLARNLAARWDEIRHDNHMAQAFGAPDPSDDRHEIVKKQALLRENTRRFRTQKRALRDVAVKLGLDVDRMERGTGGFGALIQDIGPSIGLPGSVTRGTWHVVSGLTHPSVLRSVTMSEVSYPDDGSPVLNAVFHANLATLGHALDAATLAHSTALDLTTDRGGESSLRVPLTEELLPPR